MHALAKFVVRRRRWVVGVWLLLIVGGAGAAGAASKRLVVDFSMPGQPGTASSKAIVSKFGNGGSTSPYVLTLSVPAGRTLPADPASAGAAFAAAAKAVPNSRVIDEATSGDRLFRTRDDRTAFALVFYPQPTKLGGGVPVAESALAAGLTASRPPGWSSGVTGEDALAAGDAKSGGHGVLAETVLGGVGALVVLAVVFSSFLALLPLIVALCSILLSFVFLLPLTYAVDMSFIVQFLISLIGLGVAIDYSLLLVQRWREERAHGHDNDAAVRIAMATAGKSVVFSGVTVAIGLAALVVLPVPFMRTIGIGGVLIPLASVVTTLTLTPALLAGIGPRVDWPRKRRRPRGRGAWDAWAARVVHNRLVALGAAAVVLGLLVTAFTGIKIGVANSGALAKNGPAYDTAQQLKDGGLPGGLLTPIQVLTDAGHAGSVARGLSEVPGVARVVTDISPGNTRDGRTVVVAIPEAETTNSSSFAVVTAIRRFAAGTPAVGGVAGIGADQLDFRHAVYGNFPLVLSVIAILTFLLLARGFRSVALAVKAILLNLISVAATLGFMVLLWQGGHGSQLLFGVAATGAITYWVPIMVFAFLFGLSMDYEVFILSRIREAHDRGLPTDDAVVEGVGRTGRLVTSAALILFLALVALSTGPGTDLKVMATALGFGILLDATLIRSLIVPALVSLFGSWNWWIPRWLGTSLRVGTHHRAAAVVAD